MTPVAPDEVVPTAEQLIADTNEWFVSHADRFDPLAGPPPRDEIRRKSFCEIAGLLDVAAGHGEEGPAPLTRLLSERATDPDYYRQLLREPRGFPQLAYPLAALSRRETLPAAAADAVERVAEWPAARQLGRPTSRQLDYWHVCRLYGCEAVGVDHESLFERGFAGGRLNAVVADEGVAFGLTHELLFYHNFGNDRAAFPDGTLSYDSPDTIAALLLRFLAEDHVDLVAELLFVGVLQRQLSPGLVRTTLGWLVDNVEDGALSFPTDDPAELRQYLGPDIENWSGTAREWRCRYHPTIVLGMLARTLRDDWETFRAAAPRRRVDHTAAADDLRQLGGVLSSLSEYGLNGASDELVELAETPTARAYDDVVAHATDYLERQQHDGTVGSWFAERRHYLADDADADRASFREGLLAPLAERCAAALSAVAVADHSEAGAGDESGDGGD